MNPLRFRDLAEELGLPVAFLSQCLREQHGQRTFGPDELIDSDTEAVIRSCFSTMGLAPNVWLRGWSVGGFKAFAKQQAIPLGRITLVFGPNSGGKSSLLHSLLLANEAVTSKELDVFEPKLAEGSVDLGGFRQFSHCQRSEGQHVALGCDLRPNELNAFFEEHRGREPAFKCEAVRVNFSLGAIPATASGDPLRGKPALVRLDIELDGVAVCQIGRSGDGRFRFRTLDLNHPFFISLRERYTSHIERVSGDPVAAVSHAETLMETVVLEALVDFSENALLPTGVSFFPESEEPPTEKESLTDPEGLTDEEHIADYSEEEREEKEAEAENYREARAHATAKHLMASFAKILDEFVVEATGTVNLNLSAMTYLGPLRSFPARDFSLTHARDPHWNAGGGFAWDILATDSEVRRQVNEWFASDFLKTPYEFVVTDLVSGEIVSSVIESEFADIVAEKHAEHETTRGSDSEKDKEAFHFPYDAWNTDELGKRLASAALGRASASRRTELRLIDKRTGARVSHRDVGVGLSQILPVIVRAFASPNGLHLIEQPEIHVHPALQAELGDLFIESALGSSQNRFVIETHSEHLVLRLLRRVRQTSAGELEEGRPPVRPEDIAVIYAEPTSEGTRLHHLKITPDGDFADRWPHGFFTERGDELF